MAKHIYPEHELLHRLTAGDQDAFQVLFCKYSDRIYANCLHFTKSAELAKDLTQEIFTKIWLNRAKMGNVERFDNYLFTVSRNLIRNELRKKVLDTSNKDFLDNWFEHANLPLAQQIELKELETYIAEAVAELPPQLRTAFSLSRYEGLSHDEIAQRMQISRFTSKTYIVRALDILRKKLYEKFKS